MMQTRSSNSRAGWCGVVLPTVTLWAMYITWCLASGFGPGKPWWVYVLLGCKLAIELVAILYMVCFTFASCSYLRRWQDDPPPDPVSDHLGPAAVLYLCCNDLDPEALESLANLRYPGDCQVIIHDDSPDPSEQARVDQVAVAVQRRSGRPVQVLRRPTREGGKPAAVQYVLEQTRHLYEFFLLADNDSCAHSPDVLARAVCRFDQANVAVVQCRNRTRQLQADGPFARALAWSIDIFDVLMRGLFAHLWCPFVGHNAVLRTAAVWEAGGMRPGYFADDIDLSVRLQDRGYAIRYCPDLMVGETHPRNYRAFCERTSKWATGCIQVLREHAIRVLRSRGFTPLQKIGFFLFASFYVFQPAMLLYLILLCLIVPMVWPAHGSNLLGPFLIGGLFPLTIYGPVLVYLLTHRPARPWAVFAACAGVYGSTDVATIRGLLRGIRSAPSRWIPTNSIRAQEPTSGIWAQYGLGLLMLAMLWYRSPWFLLVPTTFLFVSRFLFIPAIARHYGGLAFEAASHVRGKRIRLATAAPALGLALLLMGVPGSLSSDSFGKAAEPGRVEIRGDRFFVNAKPFEVRGIHYSPWRPGSGPGHGPLPADAQLRQDLELIVRANANTILVVEPPTRLLELAHDYGLKIIYLFYIDWPLLTQPDLAGLAQRVEAGVREHHDAPALFAWMLGHELPEGTIEQIGADGVRDLLGALSQRVRSIDPVHPVTHGDWPMTRNLGLDASLDFVSFSLYPYYPPEVAAAGFGPYIERELQPIARGRPLLISEFGMNTLETSERGQADILRRCWKELRAAGSAGGVVFEFADEWWKNYSNPVRPPNWWVREADLQDHVRHDQDPEEYYGIVTSDRNPKPAYAAVRAMFRAEAAALQLPSPARVVQLSALALVALIVSVSVWVYARRPWRGQSSWTS